MRDTCSWSASICGSVAVLISSCYGDGLEEQCPFHGAGGLFLGHERIPIVRRRGERLLDSPGADPANEVELGAGLVVGSRATGAAERLLAHHGARGLVVDVEIAGGVAQVERGVADCLS